VVKLIKESYIAKWKNKIIFENDEAATKIFVTRSLPKRKFLRNPDFPLKYSLKSPAEDLAPSWDLLRKYKKNLISWEQFTEEFVSELTNRPDALKYLRLLAMRRDTIYLLCFEKTYPCHRFILLKILAALGAKVESSYPLEDVYLPQDILDKLLAKIAIQKLKRWPLEREVR